MKNRPCPKCKQWNDTRKKLVARLKEEGYKGVQIEDENAKCVCHLMNKPRRYEDKTLLIVK